MNPLNQVNIEEKEKTMIIEIKNNLKVSPFIIVLLFIFITEFTNFTKNKNLCIKVIHRHILGVFLVFNH